MAYDVVICPRCQKEGKTVVLGAIRDGGFVMTRHAGGTTKIFGSEFDVFCGCGEKVYYKSEQGKEVINGTMLSERITWIHWQQNSGTVGTGGEYGTQG
jgi:hypothetical protein